MELSRIHHRALEAFCEGILIQVKESGLADLELFHQTQLHFLMKTKEDFRLIFDELKPSRLVLVSESFWIDYFDHEDPDKKGVLIRVPT
jgi:hypothetical protein